MPNTRRPWLGSSRPSPGLLAISRNPAENNVFGGAIVCDQALTPGKQEPVSWQKWQGSSWSMTAASATRHTIVAALRAGQGSDPETWRKEARTLLAEDARKSAAADEAKRWDEFWSRSHVVINKDAGESDKPWLVGRNYQLFRYMLACNRGGKLPLLFNGGIFTTDNFNKIKGNNNDELKRDVGGPSTPDHRHWMFCRFMAQNQRWLGWPTILAGDADLLEPSNAFYRMHAISAAARAKGLGAEGVVYPEPIGVWGLSWWAACRPDNAAPSTCNTPSPWRSKTRGWRSTATRLWARTSRRTSNGSRAPCASSIPTTARKPNVSPNKNSDADGKLSIYPANSIELLIGAKNPIEVVAGLRRLSDALAKLDPTTSISPAEKTYFAQPAWPSCPSCPRRERRRSDPAPGDCIRKRNTTSGNCRNSTPPGPTACTP